MRGYNNNSSTFDLQMPDLTGVLGWDTQYNIRSGIATNWWVSGVDRHSITTTADTCSTARVPNGLERRRE